MKLKKRFILAILLISLIAISACSLTGKKGASTSSKSKKAVEDIRVGTQGIVISYLPNNPPERLVVEQGIENPIKVVLQVSNKGAYPQPDEGVGGLAPGFGRVYLSGYDQNIIKFAKKSFDLSQITLEGKSTINPNGGIDFVTFEGAVDANNLNVERYEPSLLATACYYYFTIAGPQVCIDPDPYSTITQKKVCEVSDLSLSNQGAPIAITKITEEALATKTQFRITVKNVGGGEVLKGSASVGTEELDKCNPFGEMKLGREDIDKVFLQEVKLGTKDLQCGPFTDQSGIKGSNGFIRLINGEGSIICELPKNDYGQTNSAYITPLKIKVSYVYKNTAERKVLIRKETGGSLGGGSSGAASSAQPIQVTQSGVAGYDSQGNLIYMT